jgi:hypothetical protein
VNPCPSGSGVDVLLRVAALRAPHIRPSTFARTKTPTTM